MRGVEVFLPLDDDSKCKSDSKAARGQIKLDVLAEEAKYGRSLCENQPHFKASIQFFFFFIQDETVRGDLSSLSASRAFSIFVLFLTGDLRIKPVDTVLPSDLWIWQRSLLNALSIKQQQKKNKPPLSFSFPSPLFLCCSLRTAPSFSPPAWAAVALSESSEFPVHCSVSAWKHRRCQRLVSYKKNKKKQEKVMGWRCQLWQIKLCHTPITSLSLIIRPETRKRTHSDTHKQQAGKQRHKRGALLTMREPDDTDLEIRWDGFFWV